MVPMHTPAVVGGASCPVRYLAGRLVVCSQERLERRWFLAGPRGNRIPGDISWSAGNGTIALSCSVRLNHDRRHRVGWVLYSSPVLYHSFSFSFFESRAIAAERSHAGIGIHGRAVSWPSCPWP
jgi:hypothetical protein